MFQHVRPCLILFVSLTFLTGIVYPAIVTGIAQALFYDRANGSVLMREGHATGSQWIGQSFDEKEYFWGRPSATSPTTYNAASSSGSNLGPANPALVEAIAARVKTIREAHPDQTSAIPVDLVTSSASGLDPHISPSAAEFQVSRVAKVRGLSEDKVREIVARHTEGRTFGLLGEPRVNVLQLNLSLDAEVVR